MVCFCKNGKHHFSCVIKAGALPAPNHPLVTKCAFCLEVEMTALAFWWLIVCQRACAKPESGIVVDVAMIFRLGRFFFLRECGNSGKCNKKGKEDIDASSTIPRCTKPPKYGQIPENPYPAWLSILRAFYFRTKHVSAASPTIAEIDK